MGLPMENKLKMRGQANQGQQPVTLETCGHEKNATICGKTIEIVYNDPRILWVKT
jgi:hypothetical protein